eukprot:10046769-Prorocentrum_lima.AAC.1
MQSWQRIQCSTLNSILLIAQHAARSPYTMTSVVANGTYWLPHYPKPRMCVSYPACPSHPENSDTDCHSG